MPAFGQGGFGYGRFGIAENAPGPIYTLGIAYYLSLFTSQYQLASVFLSFADTLLLRKLDDAAQAMFVFDEAFDPDIAVGVQLDTVGLIVGVSRTVPFQPSGGVSPVLNDDTYRTLIKATIARNTWTGQVAILKDIWGRLFPGGSIVVVDEQNMTATLVLTAALSSIMRDLIVRDFIVPRPEGVLYNYNFSATPIFGFSDTLGNIISGFDSGFWS